MYTNIHIYYVSTHTHTCTHSHTHTCMCMCTYTYAEIDTHTNTLPPLAPPARQMVHTRSVDRVKESARRIPTSNANSGWLHWIRTVDP